MKTIWNTLRYTLALLACLAPAIASAQNVTGTKDAGNEHKIATYILQSEYEATKKRIEKLESDLEDLANYKQEVDGIKSSVSDAELDKYVQGDIAALLGMAQSAKDYTGPLKDKSVEFKNIYDSVYSLRRSASSIYRVNFPRDEGSLETSSPRIQALRVKAQKTGSISFERVETPALDALYAAFHGIIDKDGNLSSDPKLKCEDLKEKVVSLIPELSGLGDKLKSVFKKYKDSKLAALDAHLGAINAETADVQKLVSDERQKLADLTTKMNATDVQAGTNQNDILTRLTWAVYAMIVAIVLIFVALALFSDDMKKLIITERTMIELLSMSFLLLTVIILGTGKLINSDALGAVLGSIAGYIFGQKQGERRGAQEERRQIVQDMRGASGAGVGGSGAGGVGGAGAGGGTGGAAAGSGAAGGAGGQNP